MASYFVIKPSNGIQYRRFQCGGGIEYLHRSPASRKRQRKGNQCPGAYLGHPVLERYKYGDLALQVGGVSSIEIIKYGLESRGTKTRTGLRWLDQQQQYITDPSSRQRGYYNITNPQLSKENFKEKEKLVAGPRWVGA
jgi:hypothetical protein